MLKWVKRKMYERRLARLEADRKAYIAGYRKGDEDCKEFSSVSFSTFGDHISPYDKGYKDSLLGKFEPPEVV